MSGDRRHCKWRAKQGAKPERLDADSLTAEPLGTVRRFLVGGVQVAATHHAPGRWLLHTRSVSSDDLSGLSSVVQERRPRGTGGWEYPA